MVSHKTNNKTTTQKPPMTTTTATTAYSTSSSWTPLLRSTSCPTYLTEDSYCNHLFGGKKTSNDDNDYQCQWLDPSPRRTIRRRRSRRQSWNGTLQTPLRSTTTNNSDSCCSVYPAEKDVVSVMNSQEEEECVVDGELLRCNERNNRRRRRGGRFRKARVAITGGTMVGVGLVMIPLPTPFGCVVAGAGLSVLGKEFPAAQRILDNTKSAIFKEKESSHQGGQHASEVQPGEDETRQSEETKEEEEDSSEQEPEQKDTIIFSSFDENSSLFDDGRILYPEEDVYVRVWTA